MLGVTNKTKEDPRKLKKSESNISFKNSLRHTGKLMA